MKKLLILVLFGALAVTIAACGGQTPTPTPQPEPTAEPVEEPTAVPEVEPTLVPEKETVSTEPIIGVAPVDSATVTFENEQWVVAVEGNLPDGCTEIGEITQSVDGNIIKVEVSTTRPADMMCTQVITPYSESVILETADMPNGEYTVEVNGVAATEPVVLGEEHMPQETAVDITNTVWQWAEFQDTAELNDITVDNPENYTITFLADDQVSIKADCNMVNGSYTLDGSSLTIQLGPSTMAFCGEESLDQQFLEKLGFVATYVMDGENLVMNLQADAGNMIFANGGPAGEAGADTAVTVRTTIDPGMVRLDTQGLPISWQAVYVPETPYDQSQPPGPKGLPAHIEILFGVTDPAQRRPGDPVMYIIPVAAYEAMWQANGNDSVTTTMAGIYQTTTVLTSPPPTTNMPVLPVEEVGGKNDVALYVSRATSDENSASKSGYRFVGRFAQDANPITSDGLPLQYIYQGFTNDGQYLVSFFYPVTSSALPTNADVNDAFNEAVSAGKTEEFLAQQIEEINSLSPSDWEPDLATLDALVGSLQIEGMVSSGPIGPEWQWVRSERTDSFAVENPELYTLTYDADGTFALKADCNNVSGDYTMDSGIFGSVQHQPGPSTLAECGEGSRYDYFVNMFPALQNYKVRLPGDELELIWPADGGSEFFQNPVPGIAVVAESAGPISKVVGKTWQWVSFSDPANGLQDIPEPERYEMVLNEDGSINVKADCNQVSGSYTVEGSAIEITFGPSTLAACPEDSLGDQFVQDLSFARILFLQDGDLFFDLMADGGTMRFSESGSAAAESEEPPLTGTPWKWVTFSDPVNGLQTIPEADRYQMTLNEDGSINIQADCNQVNGTYTLEDGSIEIILGPSTLAACPEDSLADQFLQNLTNARIYFAQDGSLFFDLLADGGTMRFDPATQGEVTGTVTYMVRSALPNDAVLTVQIQDTSLADAPATVMGESWYVTGGAQVPLPFAVAYNPEFIQDNHTYTLSVRITDGDDNLLFINDTSIPVITNGNPTTDIEVVVVPTG
ncbi:MAG: META domain-containing protein [Chloroflexi bacterium]|nr:META domain-containing protein [Chloroflexota bacterium]